MDYVVYIAIAVLAILGTLYFLKHQDKKAFKQFRDAVDAQIQREQEREAEFQQRREELQSALSKLKDKAEEEGGYMDTINNFEEKYRQK